MKTIKPGKISVLTRTFEREGQAFLVVAPLVFFELSPTRRLLSEQAMWKFVPGELGEQVLDLGMPKVRGEVLLCGKAHPWQAPKSVCSVRLKLGSVDKRLDVVGDRTWRRGAPTDPEPFTEMPLTWSRAFGGAGYAQNPQGKGFGGDGDNALPLPNVEHAGRLMRSPKERPAPAGFLPYDIAWPQRQSKAGTYDKKWQKTRFPGFPSDMSWSIFNAAPDDQQIQGYFVGDEAFVLENLHASEPSLEGRLPCVRTRVFLRQRGQALEEISTRLDTVWLFPHARRGLLVFRALARVAEDDAADVRQMVLACEALGEERPARHYAEVLAMRMNKKSGGLAALRDRDLLPASDPPEPRAPRKVPGALTRKRLRRRLEDEHATLLAHMNEQGMDTSKIPPLPPEPEEEAPELDDLGEFVEKKQAEAERAKAGAEAERVKAEQQVRDECAKHGLDYDAMMAAEKAKWAGPPKVSAKKELETLRGLAQMAANAGTELPQVSALLADPDLERRLTQAETTLRDAYRRFAHSFPPASRLQGDEAARVRAEVARAAAAHESLAGRDLTGADLRGIDLTRADLRGAFLEAADLSGVNLGGADLASAVLTRVNAAGANLFAAKLAGANLGGATLTDAELGESDLRKATLSGADLTRASLRRARLEGAVLLDTKLRGADASGMSCPKAKLYKLDLSGTKLVGAQLPKAIVLECTLDGTDFTQARLTGGSFVKCHGEAPCFRGADLEQVSFAGESSLRRAVFAAARMHRTNLRGLDLTAAVLDGAQLVGADLSECTLRGADLRGARAREARFVRADLSDARLEGIDLMEGSLAKATLHGADLRRANLFRADLTRAKLDTATRVAGALLDRALMPRAEGDGA